MMFQVEGKPLIVPPRFRPLFNAIFYRNYDRVNVIAPTQDGKSTTIAAAVVLIASATDERFTIVAPSEKKADIIMSQVREFATQHPVIYTQLELDRADTLDRLKRERSKKNITFKRGGGVQTLTLDARNSKNSIQAAMGFGSKNIIADEAGLVEDPLWATVMRMLGGDFKDDERKKILVKIGNPFFRNHFYRSSQDSRYHQVFHNWEDSVRDWENGYYGYTPDYIDEMRDQAFFDVFYECTFPDEDMIDAKGYRQLIAQKDIKQGDFEPEGTPILGCDIGGGGDYNVYTIRWNNGSKVVGYNLSDDTMTNVTEIQRIYNEYPDLVYENVNIDDVGIGRGVRDRCWELGMEVNGVSSGARSEEPDKYSNINIEMAWDMRSWLLKGGILEPLVINGRNVWDELTWYKYKVNTSKQMKMEPKPDMKKRTGKSPDFGDSLRLTFARRPEIGIIEY